MSQRMFGTNKPKRADNIIWRLDGEKNQICILSKDGFVLPLILNYSAAKIFFLCDGKNSVEDIANSLCREFKSDVFTTLLEDVREQIKDFIKRGVVQAEDRI